MYWLAYFTYLNQALQETLPRLPIPNLADTCARYLNAQRPLLTDAEFAATSDTVSKFKKGEF